MADEGGSKNVNGNIPNRMDSFFFYLGGEGSCRKQPDLNSINRHEQADLNEYIIED